MIPDTWQKKELADLVTFKSGGTPAKSKEEYWNGDIPWISAKDMKSFWLTTSQINISLLGAKNGTTIAAKGTLLILVRGMTLRKDVPVCVTSREMAFNQDVKGLVPKDINPIYLAYYLCSRKSQLLALVNEAGHGTGRLQTDFLESFPVLVPEVKEQDLIADLLVKWDRAIELKERLIAVKQERRTWLMQQLLSGKRRLPMFKKTDNFRKTPYGELPAEWAYPRIGDVAIEKSERNGKGIHRPVLSCTKHRGLVDSLQYFGKRIFSEDLSSYKVVPKGHFAYATNHIEEGSIGYQDSYGEALISPIYTVFETNDTIDDHFLLLVLKTETYRHIFCANTSASVDRRGSLRWSDFSKIHIPCPSIEEQQAIVKVFDIADRELSLLRSQLDALREQKKGLMQQLLTGKVRVKV